MLPLAVRRRFIENQFIAVGHIYNFQQLSNGLIRLRCDSAESVTSVLKYRKTDRVHSLLRSWPDDVGCSVYAAFAYATYRLCAGVSCEACLFDAIFPVVPSILGIPIQWHTSNQAKENHEPVSVHSEGSGSNNRASPIYHAKFRICSLDIWDISLELYYRNTS